MINNLKYLKILLKGYFFYKNYVILSLNNIKNNSKMIILSKQNQVNNNKNLIMINRISKNIMSNFVKTNSKIIILIKHNLLNTKKKDYCKILIINKTK